MGKAINRFHSRYHFAYEYNSIRLYGENVASSAPDTNKRTQPYEPLKNSIICKDQESVFK